MLMKRAIITMLGCLCATSLCSCQAIFDAYISWGDSLRHQEISFEEISDWVQQYGWWDCYIENLNNPIVEQQMLRFDDDQNLIINILCEADKTDITDRSSEYDWSGRPTLEFQCGKGYLRLLPGDLAHTIKGDTESWATYPDWYYKFEDGTYQKCLEVAYSLYDAANQAPNHAS